MTTPEETPSEAPGLEFPTFYPDYDDLTRLTTTGEKVAWLEGRVRKTLLRPLRRIQVLRKRAEAVDVHLIVVYSICGGIESLSHFYRGGKGRGHFVEFCHRYLPAFRRRDRHGRSYATLLYDNFRSSLSHGFCIEQGRLEPGARHGRLDGRYGLEIDPWVLLRELETALARYLEDVREDEELQESFEKRFNSVFRHWIRMSERRAQEQKRPEPKS